MVRVPWEINREMFLSAAEVARLLTHVRERETDATVAERIAASVDRVIVETLLFSGLRCSEFCGLRVADAPPLLSTPTLIVRGKLGGERTVWIPASLVTLIDAFVRDVRPMCLPAGADPKQPDLPLILNERGRAYERTALYRRVVGILEAAGFGDRASVQLLRHTYGYFAYLQTGGNLLFVQRQLGHAHPMITSIYAQFVDESYADLANRVAHVPVAGAASDVPESSNLAKRKAKI